ncbi:hypothetical protein [Frigoribacterium sp. RIT-PI-h]|uniref:hypothetical protein n=1 Tax=Frigoribacterium sp. RIT-PI-h TaxID=1690245 RepID=UPI0006B95BC7|nr:hypothetical protein [Frigoribacterium sp. RIT-PI-h]KPG85401.1 hypothetical protein AEQ27_05830 [Frigoribacterium sp. RIT-PI-h]
MSPAPTRPPVVLRTLVVTGALALSLTACTAPSQAAPSVTPTSGAQASASPGATPTTAPTPDLVSTPFAIDCDDLLDTGSLSSWYPGLTTVPGGSAGGDESRGGEALQQVADADGTTCTWQDSSGATGTVGGAHFDPDSPAGLANDRVATSNSVPTCGGEGYFDTPGEIGTAEAFSSPAFVVARSTTFLEPGDAEPVVSAVLSALEQVD